MTENDVKVIVNEAFSQYEESTGKPRHNENLGNFTELFRALNWLKGLGAGVFFIIGVPSLIASIMTIVKLSRGH